MVIRLKSIFGYRHGPSKFFTRSTSFAAVLLICLSSVLYLSWFIPGFSVTSGYQRLLPLISGNYEAHVQWDKSPRRLIVFGDSWSDNGQYPIDAPPKGQLPPRDEARGKVWTEWLCLAISCIHHDNFARSLPYSRDNGFIGAVVDSDVLNSTLTNATNLNDTRVASFETREPLADLRSQVQQWLKFEKKQYSTSRVSETERKGTIFTVWFSLWDLWYYSGGNLTEAEMAISKTMDTLFEQLDVIAENFPAEMKVIVPEAIDSTFLPGWYNARTGPRGSDPRGEEQRSAILLVEQWNLALDRRASRWKGGSMYIYNTNEWLLDQVREQELYASGLTDHNGMGVAQSPWNNVRRGCVAGSDKSSDGEAKLSRCKDPDTYLFWDDMHLGPEAMTIIGKGIAQDIGSNHGSSWFAHEVELTYGNQSSPSVDPLPEPPKSKSISETTPSSPALTKRSQIRSEDKAVLHYDKHSI